MTTLSCCCDKRCARARSNGTVCGEYLKYYGHARIYGRIATTTKIAFIY
jgi:hypothetical protein